MRKAIVAILLLTSFMAAVNSQKSIETVPPDLPDEQTWWNLLHYSIDITPSYSHKFIKGSNEVQFKAVEAGTVMQVDLQRPMAITNVKWKNRLLKFKRESDIYKVYFPKTIARNNTETITIFFEGKPTAAKKPPWDSGWIWSTDDRGRPWMSIACEGSGAAIWMPCKNLAYDEPDNGIRFSITAPGSLVAVANGRLSRIKRNKNNTTTYTWKVTSPINNYNIIPYIGNYVYWHENYAGLKGNLDCDYWVLDYNLAKAKNHFKAVDTMLHCFEYWLGPYPFYEDSYKLVEAPMVGMEHQSAIAYGNHFENGYGRINLSGTKWGLLWDFILVHESGHEWFGNNITASNGGESWIHEGFTKYLETIYTGYLFGQEAATEYTLGIRKRILNDTPIIGSGTSDCYNKSSAMLHMIREIVGDSRFRNFLRGLNKTFYHSTINTEQILKYLNEITKQDFSKVFDQYLKTVDVPVLEYSFSDSQFRYRWSNCVNDFDMPVKVSFDEEKYDFIYPTIRWQKINSTKDAPEKFTVDKNFYIKVASAVTN